MNILIPDSWLREYLETKANPKKISQCLSLCGPSVERVIKKNNDYLYDIEVTSNRIDMASIIGIAREAAAILPQFGIKAKLRKDFYQKIQNSSISHKIPQLKVVIKNPALCPRFSAIILDNIKVKPSSKIIKERLEKVGVRNLNNVIDISNYLMHELGQPVHIFDYDKIGRQTMILRESKKGEKITTLDGKTHSLPGKDIIIEDGEGKLIDLCGIMGGKNSCVDNQTKKIILFVQNYEPSHIRRTSMILAQRTEAATLFEKNIDPELVAPTMALGIQLIKEEAGAKINSKILDLYPHPYQKKEINLPVQLIEQYLGIKIQLIKVVKILESLGFKSLNINRQQSIVKVSVPSWRAKDVSLPQDLIEEIARIYGYHNLPSKLPDGKLPQNLTKQTFSLESKIKHSLSDWGYTEIKTYSMQSKSLIEKSLLQPLNHLAISNPLTQDWTYMRRSLMPSFLAVLAKNQKQKVKIFELGKVFLKKENNLPEEKLQLIIGQNAKRQYFHLKGIMEILFQKFNIKKYQLKNNHHSHLFHPFKSAQIYCQNQLLGKIGEINSQITNNFDLKSPAAILLLDFGVFNRCRQEVKIFTPLAKYESIIEDLTFTLDKPVFYADLVKLIKSCSTLIKEVKLLDSYQDNRTFRISYRHHQKNLSSQDINHIRKKIIETFKSRGWGKLKEKGTG